MLNLKIVNEVQHGYTVMETFDVRYRVNDDSFGVLESVVVEISVPFVGVDLVKDDVE